MTKQATPATMNGVRDMIDVLQEWSVPLLAGVFMALLVANASPHTYHVLVHEPITHWANPSDNLVPANGHKLPSAGRGMGSTKVGKPPHESGSVGTTTKGGARKADPLPDEGGSRSEGEVNADEGFSEYLTLHFVINDLFMVLFFGIATKEIVESCLPGGALNPPRKAVNPLLGTIGGVLGPIGVYLLLNHVMGKPDWHKGWGIPTATDIALAWLVARMVFGKGHPAISFLLLLAVADDAIGLGIIAFGYPDPAHPTQWLNMWWTGAGMAIALLFRLLRIGRWWPYILVGGAFSWWGFHSAHLHPALALVPIVPFLPHAKMDPGLFKESAAWSRPEHHPLEQFEHDLKLPVDFGLFFFGFANAGVEFNSVDNLTWMVVLALLLGKVIGITALSFAGDRMGFKLPDGMKLKHLFTAGLIAGTGLTVALFVAGQAFKIDPVHQSAAKMGALFSGFIGVLSFFIGRSLGVNDHVLDDVPSAAGSPEASGKAPADAAV